MLKPLQLYKDEVQLKEYDTWHNLRYMYSQGGAGTAELSLNDNNAYQHAFVSVDNHNEVIGIITYRVDWESRSVYGVCCESYDIGNILFAKDVIQAFKDIFSKYNLNRVEWRCYEDNPAIRGYRKLLKRFGGKEVGKLRNTTLLMDGKLHNMVIFEILREDLKC